jgi:DNA replication protein DnaC
VAHLTTSQFIVKAQNIVLLGPGTGKTHLSIGLGIAAAQHGHRVLFATAVEWVTRLQTAPLRLPGHTPPSGRLLRQDFGYIPFGQDAANLFFQLVSSRYEHASLILTSNLPFSRWGDVFSDPERGRHLADLS